MATLARTTIPAADNVSDALTGHAVVSTDSSHRPVASCVEAADFLDIFCGEFGTIVPFSFRGIATIGLPPLISHISEVVSPRAKKQMGGIATGWVIASMADAERFIERPIGECIGNSMCHDSAPVRIADGKGTIPVLGGVTVPWPTGIVCTYGDFRPEPFFDGCNVLVPTDEAIVLPSDNATFGPCTCSAGGMPSASALADSDWEFVRFHGSPPDTDYTTLSPVKQTGREV